MDVSSLSQRLLIIILLKYLNFASGNVFMERVGSFESENVTDKKHL